VNDARPDPSPDQASLQLLRRTALYERQTGGGLSLDGPGSRPSDPARVARVHELARALRDLRPAAPARAVAALSARKQPGRVLDLGAGRAPWSLAFTRLNSDVQVTAVDLPREVPALRAAVTAAGCAHQYRFVANDFFDPPVESLGSFDLVIVPTSAICSRPTWCSECSRWQRIASPRAVR
jgi:SAM-dependent methyltransferase